MDPVDSAIACNLPSSDRGNRLKWIEQLNTAALRAYAREGSRIELRYDSGAAARVGELVRAEQRCCPFLEFTIDDDENALIVTIEAPADVSDAADEIFTRSIAT